MTHITVNFSSETLKTWRKSHNLFEVLKITVNPISSKNIFLELKLNKAILKLGVLRVAIASRYAI